MTADTSDATRRTGRTAVQVVLALLPIIPLVAPVLIDAFGLVPTAGIGALITALAAAVSRIMAIEAIDDYLPAALRKYPPRHGGY